MKRANQIGFCSFWGFTKNSERNDTIISKGTRNVYNMASSTSHVLFWLTIEKFDEVSNMK